VDLGQRQVTGIVGPTWHSGNKRLGFDLATFDLFQVHLDPNDQDGDADLSSAAESEQPA
jgi:hypothetical protein